MRTLSRSCLMLLVLFCLVHHANAGTIISPVAVINNTAGVVGDGISQITNAIDHSGLTIPFISGVTDFNTYIGTNPTHSWIYVDSAEWFSRPGVTAGTVDFDLGAAYTVNQLALWNEEFSGLLTLNVTTSNDPLFGTGTVVGNFNPTDNPFDQNYPAEVFALASTTAQYVRFEMTGPQIPNRGTYLSIGEVAFDVTPIPEPTSLLLLASGLIGLGVAAWRRKK